jgi:toxin-antitoxin system PIN domain toxin
VIAVDTNLLVYAHRADSPWHDRAAARVRALAEGPQPWAIPWPCVHEFLAIVTHPRIFKTPTPLAGALDQAAAWFESPSLSMLQEGDGYWAIFQSLVVEARVAGPRVHDARIAALCLSHGVLELWSADRDFSLFPSLTVRNPLTPSG